MLNLYLLRLTRLKKNNNKSIVIQYSCLFVAEFILLFGKNDQIESTEQG